MAVVEATCVRCGITFTRKMSELVRVQTTFCGVACRKMPTRVEPVDGDASLSKVVLTQGYHAIVDTCDLPLIVGQSWRANIRKVNKHLAVYAITTGPRPAREPIYLHRLILQAKEGVHVDHINHDSLDCRRANLRLCTRSENSANSRRFVKHGCYRGVYAKKDKFVAGVFVRGAVKWVGTYDTAEQAARARDIAASATYGDFAMLNFPAAT